MKETLIKLAKEAGFHSEILSDEEWKHSNKEKLRYYMWMCELKQWVADNYKTEVNVVSDQLGYTVHLYDRAIFSWTEKNFVDICQFSNEALEKGLIKAFAYIEKKSNGNKEDNKE